MSGPGEIAALAAIACLGALIFGITGFGAALVTIPLATHFVPLPFALALFALADLAMALSVGLEKPRNAVRPEWTRLVPMIVAGTALGVTLLVNLPRQAGMMLLGAFVFSYALYSLLRKTRTRVVSSWWAWVAGLAGGSISLRVVAFVLTGLLLQPSVWKAALAVVPAALAGIFVARLAFNRISRDALLKAVSLMLLASGGSLVVRALG
jgi:uncharacterized membrane protein YfcA